MPAAIGSALVGAGLSATAASVIVGVGRIVVGLGINAVIGRIRQRQQSAAQAIAAPGLRQDMTRQTVSPRIRYMGTVRVSGPVFWWANDTSVQDGWMHVGIIVNFGRIEQILGYFLDAYEVEINGSNEVTTAPYADATDKAYIYTNYGAVPETAYVEISNNFGVGNVRGDGIATVLGIFDDHDDAADQAKIYPNGPPKIRVTHTGSVAWDPRDPNQERSDETTWRATDNPVVHLLHYMMSDDGFAWPWERVAPAINLISIEADACDELVATKAGGTEKRYRIGGGYALNTDPVDVVALFEATCDGRVWQRRDGTLGIAVGRFRAPTVTLGDDDILAYDLVRGQDLIDAVSGIRAQYMSPDHGYYEQDADPWPSVAAVEGGSGRAEALDLTWVPSHGQARRLMKRAYLKANAGWAGTIVTNLAGLRALDERYINLVITELGISESFEVGPINLDLASMQVEIEVVAVSSAIDAWDPATEEGTAPAAESEL